MAMLGKRTFQFTVDGKWGANYTPIALKYFEVRKMQYGAKRREEFMNLFNQGLEFYVNCKHCINLKHDYDMQKLLKQGKIEMVNERQTRGWSFAIKHTFLRLKKKVK